ncbi:MAG: 3-keto-5-aminohexanoate cleavage protein [Candidatus Izemoplasmatales bacterium]|jgi:3-keto-5-aminohexanoate cleavage enzyme|nr:3-keto-5-aminohexanoate cleavage protein [Candidatus Izemoplasmatales bacterium]MDD3865135.1 3-keto-5-aminohexanoate cleavage protein [Candidatus Izemoplasmatales bacterium]
MTDKLIITCAMTGAEVTKEGNPAVPYTVNEMVVSACEAVKAGASVLHIHARRDDGTPVQDAKRFAEILSAIRKECPKVILQVSTGGAVGMSRDERLGPLTLNPEMATLDCGTLNFGGDDIFVNTENDIIYFAKVMQAKQVAYELECFEKGHVDTVLRLVKKGIITQPLRFSFVLGVNGGMSGETRDLAFLKESIPDNATFSVAGVGRYEFSLAEQAILCGGHVRVGLEDNLYLEKGVLAKSNAELVHKVVEIASRLGREIATPEEARRILRMEIK